MSAKNEPSIVQVTQTEAASELDGALQSIARRKALLKGLGKGAALAGAAVPLRSLAGGGGGERKRLRKTDGKDYRCTVSGQMSVILSAGGTAPDQCWGHPCSKYRSNSGRCDTNQSADWPGWKKDVNSNAFCYKDSRSTNSACYPRSSFANVFGGGSTNRLGELCNNGNMSNDEVVFCVALLNSNLCPDSFPDLPEDVIGAYKSDKRASACTLYRDWLSRGQV